MAYEFKLPDLGEGVREGEIARWLVEVGQEVAEDEPLVEIQTDKTTVEIPSPAAQVHEAFALIQSVGAIAPARAAAWMESGNAGFCEYSTLVPYM